MNRNLLEQTIIALNRNNKTPEDVLYVSDGVSYCSFNQFIECAKHYIYDNGYGHVQVTPWLKIVGKDWWLARREYDGAQWWQYLSYPAIGQLNKSNKVIVSSDEYQELYDKWE